MFNVADHRLLDSLAKHILHLACEQVGLLLSGHGRTMNLDVDVLLQLGRHAAAWGVSQSRTFRAATLGWNCHFGFRLSQDSP
eukprot:10110554-Heterocapsa_arctica.AAC.1